MGRKKIHLTEVGKATAQNKYAMSYYERNKKIIKDKAKKKYELRKNLQSNNGES